MYGGKTSVGHGAHSLVVFVVLLPTGNARGNDAPLCSRSNRCMDHRTGLRTFQTRDFLTRCKQMSDDIVR